MAAAVHRPSGFAVHPAVNRASGNLSTKQTYSVAHSAQCKLNLAANRPDRNLRYVLGHAFTLDKVLLRIVEIENESAKDIFDNDKPDGPSKSEIQEEDDAKAGIGGGAGVRVGESGSLARPQRRISFSNQTKPSDITGGNGNGKSGRDKSPPPQKKQIPKGYEDDESTDSDDDYDDPTEFARALDPQTAINLPAGAEDNDPLIDDYDQDDAPLGLQRFASATAAPPRKHSPSPPPMTDSDSEEDDEPPKSPPIFPDDVVRESMVEEESTELHEIYETIRGCPCGDDHGVAPPSKGMWTIKTEEKDGRSVRYGVVKV
jgi:hypothetical protein